MTLRFQDLDWTQTIRRHFDAWTALLLRGGLDPSLLPDWVVCGADAAGRFKDLRVFLTFEGDQLIGLLPYVVTLRRMAGLPIRVMEAAGNFVAYHQEVVAQGRQREVLSGLLAPQNTTAGWDALLMEKVPTLGPTRQALEGLAAEQSLTLIAYPGESSPYLEMTGSWDQMLGSKSSNLRYRVRKRERELDSNPDYALRWFEGPVDTAPLLADILKIEAGCWKVAEGMDIPSSPMETRYHERLLPMLAKKGLLLANVLYIRGEPAAYYLCVTWNGRIGNLKSSYHERFAEAAPGLMTFEATLRRAYRDGYEEFDFLGPEMRHKLSWNSGTRAHDTILLCNSSIRGQALGLAKQASRALRAWQGRRRSAAPEGDAAALGNPPDHDSTTSPSAPR